MKRTQYFLLASLALLILASALYAGAWTRIGHYGISAKSARDSWDGPFNLGDFTTQVKITSSSNDRYDSFDVWGFSDPDEARSAMRKWQQGARSAEKLRQAGGKRIKLIQPVKTENVINVSRAVDKGYYYMVIIQDWQGTLTSGKGVIYER